VGRRGAPPRATHGDDSPQVAEGRDDNPFPSQTESSYFAVSAADPEPLLSVDQVARWLGKPKATLYAWRSRGQGPPGIRVGNALRYRRTEVERWLDERSDQPSDA
jgi:excisionase family DNA binding protein